MSNLRVKRRKTNRGIEVFNPVTKRYVLETGATARPILEDAIATKFGNIEVKARAPYTQNLPQQSKGWTKIVFKREEDTTVVKMINNIIEQKKVGRSNLYVDIRYLSESYPFETFRSVKLAGHTKQSLFRYIIDTVSSNSKYRGGSDEVDDRFDVDTKFFAIKFKSNGGGNERDRHSSIKTEFFKSQSYKCPDGDCLLAILREGKTRFETIRKNIGLKKGLIQISDIKKVEDYFEVNIDILDDSIEILSRECVDNEDKNRTNVNWDYVYKYRSELKYEGDTFEILLKDEHYSLIVKKREVFFDRVCGDKLTRISGDFDNKPIQMTSQQRQKSLLRQDRKVAKMEEVIQRSVKYIFFDIETIFDPDHQNYLSPYSIAWWVCDAISNPPKFTPKNIKKHISDTHMIIGNDCMEKFVDWIENNDKDTKFILIGYNNSRFDNFPLLNQVISADIFTHMLFVQNSVLKLTFSGRHTTFDLCRFVSDRLDRACDSFNVYPKKMKGFSHFAPQDAFMKDGWTGLFDWMDTNEVLLSEYNKTDVLATANLFFIVRQAYAKITKADILDYTTLASLSFDCFKNSISSMKEIGKTKDGKSIKKRVWKYDISAPPTHELDKLARSGAVGGRCQKFIVKLIVNELLKCVDVKSLYPYIMLNRCFPHGEIEYTETFLRNKMGMYNVKVITQPKVKIIPKRGEESLDWESNEEITTMMTSVEILCLERHGAVFEFLPLNDETDAIGIYWEEYSDCIFKDFFEEIKNEKTRQDRLKDAKSPLYNPALRNICKLLLNSLSGKPLQRNFDTTIEMIRNQKDEDKFNQKVKEEETELVLLFTNYVLLSGKIQDDKVYNPKTAKPSYLAVFIYAHARTYMYDTLYSRYDVIYTDTDSAVLKQKDYEDFASKGLKKIGKAPHYYYDLCDNTGNYVKTKEFQDYKKKVMELDIHVIEKDILLTEKIGKKKVTPTIGGEFGQFEEEFLSDDKVCESYFIAKKVYAVEIRDKTGKLTDKSKYRMKGINLGLEGQSTWDCIISKEDAIMIKELHPSLEVNKILYNMFKDELTKKRDPMEPFRRLDRDGECHFFCSKLMKKNLNIVQAFSVKSITKDDL
jgi:DNA polymerase type B, organellar and viral